MSVSPDSFWDRLTQSGIVVPAVSASLRTQFQSVAATSNPGGWLTENGILTPFQAQLLAGGYAGPFGFSEYILQAPRPPILGQATFSARHQGTHHPVQVCFVRGTSREDAHLWQAVAQRVRHLRSVDHPHLLQTFECVALAEYRFVVVENSGGKSLHEKLGSKGRVDWKLAVQLVRGLAQAVAAIHAVALVHGNLSDQEVFVDSAGNAAVGPPFWPIRIGQTIDNTTSNRSHSRVADFVRPDCWTKPMREQDDIFALCVLLYRAIRGETPQQFLRTKSADSAEIVRAVDKLSKYDIPAPLSELLRRGLSGDSTQPLTSAADFLNALEPVATDLRPIARAPVAKSREPFLEWLERWRPATAEIAVAGPDAMPDPSPIAAVPAIGVALQVKKTEAPGRKNKRRRRTQFTVWLTCAAAIIASFFAISRAIERGDSVADAPDAPVAIEARDQRPPVADANGTDKVVDADVGEPAGVWRQTLVDDNHELLWQSPTEGAPIDFKSFPPGAALIIATRPSELATHEESGRIVQSLGEEFETYVAGLESVLTVPMADIRQLITGYYPAAPTCEVCWVVRLVRPMPQQTLVAQWMTRGYTPDSNQSGMWVYGEQALGISLSTPAKASDVGEPTVDGFVVGRVERVAEALQVMNSNPLSGPLAQLVSRTDEQRHWTILALKSAAFGELGRQLLPDRFHPVQGHAGLLIEDQVRAFVLSGHLDEGTYVELVFDKSADIGAKELKAALDLKLNSARDRIRQFLAGIPSDPHWDQVRIRFDGMLTDLFRQLRIGVEYDQVLLNAWLPPMAPHNLLAAAELTISAQTGGESVRPVDNPTMAAPADLAELLATRRTLQNENPPDLNVLLDGLQREIENDYPGLPFSFQIRLSNTDLAEAGITRNQRLGPLALVDLPLSELLTQICYLANPDKSASSPADPKCKLIWVRAPGEEINSDVILITTRQGAAKNGWTIPAEFQPPPAE
jgi:hypothetical protein